MGAFFTNIHILDVDPTRLRAAILAQLRAAGLGEAGEGDRCDRELLIVPGARWTALFDERSEDQDSTAADWARTLSGALATDAFSVLVHDSDVLDLTLYQHGKRRDHYDSNPGFSGKSPSKITPAARAAKWAHLLADGHTREELAAVFACRGIFAEEALDTLAPALGIDRALLRTGYNYLTHDGDPLPASLLRIRLVLAERPPWERRLSGPPCFASVWEQFLQAAPEIPPTAVLEGQPVHLSAQVTNRGGAANGVRIEVSPCDVVELEHAELVVVLPGRHAMARHPVPLARVGEQLVAELPDAALQPGMPADWSLVEGAPMQARMDAQNAGRLHLNLHGVTRRTGRAEVAVRFIPLENPGGAHTEQIVVEVRPPRGAPLRARDQIQAHELERLTRDAHTFVLLLFDEPADRAREHALALLEALRPAWPEGRWYAVAWDQRDLAGDEMKLHGALRDDKVFSPVAKAIRTAERVAATCGAAESYDPSKASAFEVDLGRELPTLALSLAKSKVPLDRAEGLLVPLVDALAREGVLAQGLLARWEIIALTSDTPYESVVGIWSSDETARRAWATRWLRAIGPGQLWLGPTLHRRASELALPASAVALGDSLRIPVADVPALESLLAPLLPSADDYHAFARSLREPLASD